MRRFVVVMLGVLASCSGATHGPDGKTEGAPIASPLERARAYERGAGVARDYAAAVAIYAQACRDGLGDPVACNRLVDAAAAGRGFDGPGHRRDPALPPRAV